MPLQQGEVSLLTLFADIHTYLAPPISKPAHHRFDRRSYLYLFHDALNKRGRIEIANNAGTPEQDAFAGYLDMARIEYTYKQPTLFTITVDARGQGSPVNDISQWHLPAFDPRNENKYMYKIHTLDIYLWTVEDASLLIDSFRRVLQPHQLVLKDVPPGHTEHRNSMSPVVQQLESMAVNVQPQRTPSATAPQSFPPPPPSQPTNGTPASPPATQQTFTPVAYNPAAPSAPEQRVHREKTPPPPDADTGTGLNGAAHHEQGYHPGPQQGGFAAQQQGGFAPQQGGFGPQQSSYTGHPGMQRTNTMGSVPPPPASASPYQTSFSPQQTTPMQHPQSASPYQTTFAGPPQQASTAPDPYAQQPSTPGLQRQSTYPYQQGSIAPQTHTQYATSPPPPQQPYSQPLQSPGFAPQQQQSYTPQQTSGYQPAASQPYNPASTTHAMHTQFYTPEGASQPATAGVGTGGGHGKMDPSRLDETAKRIEGKVGKFLKRLDKKM